MKRFISIFIIIVLSCLLLTACKKNNVAEIVPENGASQETDSSNEGEASKDDTVKEEKPVDVSKLMSNSYNELFKSGRYFLKYEGIVDFDPEDAYSTVTIASDGNKLLWIIESQGSKNYILNIGDTAYMIDDTSKTYMTGKISNLESSFIDFSSLEFVETQKEVVDDKKMVYEDYSYDIGTLRYCFYKKELLSMINTNSIETVDMKIIEFSENVTDDMFEIPAGYKEV